MKSSRLFMAAGGLQAYPAHATISLRQVMAKSIPLAKQSRCWSHARLNLAFGREKSKIHASFGSHPGNTGSNRQRRFINRGSRGNAT
jgi:hypothetical protein